MEVLLSLSIALLTGLLLSRLAKLAKLPAVTAYLVAGILVGPFCLGAFNVGGLGFTFSNIDDKIMRLKAILPELEGQKGILRMENYEDGMKNITFNKDS